MAARLRMTCALAVDLVVLTVMDDELCVLAVRRGVEPHAGQWALPGGFVEQGEELVDAAQRELTEETGVVNIATHLEQLATFGTPGRDPRGRVVSVAYLALVPHPPTPTSGSDAADARWLPAHGLLKGELSLAFDHSQILRDGVERARSKLEYSPLACAFCAPEFTVAELRRVYEIVWDTQLDPRNFHRKVTRTAGFLRPTGRTTTRDGGRPAQLYRRGRAAILHPAMLR